MLNQVQLVASHSRNSECKAYIKLNMRKYCFIPLSKKSTEKKLIKPKLIKTKIFALPERKNKTLHCKKSLNWRKTPDG